MGAKQDIEASLREKQVTSIPGQPTDRTLTKLKKELTKIAGSVPTAIGGGKHGHAGLIIEESKYITVSNGGVTFNIPAHPGMYPETVSDDVKVRASEEAKHKGLILEHEVCAGVEQVMKDFIVEAVDEEWLSEIEDEVMGFANTTTIDMLKHLESRGGAMDYIDTKEIKKERDDPWDVNEHVVTYFNRVEQAVKQLDRAAITTDKKELLHQALYTFKESGELEQGLVNWIALDKTDHTWAKCKEHFTKEYADRRKHASIDAKQAGFGSAALAQEREREAAEAEEAAAMTCEIIQQMQDHSDKKYAVMETMMKKLMAQNEQLMKAKASTAGPTANPTATPRGPPREKRLCGNCGKMVYHPDDNCFELEKNADKRPSWWVSSKK